MTCIDTEEDEYTVGFHSEILASKSPKCKGFTYDIQNRIIHVPFITTSGSPYEGSYIFWIFGANLENTRLFSEVLQIDVIVAYDTDNTSPYFPTMPADLRVG